MQRSVWIALALAVIALPAVAQSEGHVSWQARHGLGGVHRFGGTLPVTVRLESRGEPDLRLRLECSTSAGRVTREIELPAGSRKQLTFYLAPLQFEHEITVELNEVGGRTIGEMILPTETAGLTDLVVGIVGDHPLGWNLWEHRGVHRAHLRAVDLPSASDGLTGLDVMVWAAPSLDDLTAEQIAAIGQWTERGGLLVLALGASWLESSTGAFDEWTRIRAATVLPEPTLEPLDRLAKSDLGRLDPPLAVARLDSSPEQTWLEDDRGALAAVERRGLGSVVLLGFDPSAPQIAGWSGWDEFWIGLVRQGGLHVRGKPGDSQGAGALGDWVDVGTVYWRFVSIDPSVSLPSFAWLTIWFVGYLLIIGPVEYLLLKRFNRLAWTWISFPVVAVLFSLGAYQFALANRGPEAQQARQLRTRDLLPGSGVFVERLDVGMFVQRQGILRMDVDGSWPVARSMSWQFPELNVSSGLPWNTEPVYAQYPASLTARMPKWSWLLGSFSGTTPSGGAHVDAALRIDGNTLGGSIKIALGSEFAEKRIVTLTAGELSVFSVDDVGDGVTAKLAVSRVPVDPSWKALPKTGTPEEVFKRVLYETVRGIARSEVSPDPLPDPYHDWSHLIRDGGAVLLAWVREEERVVHTAEGAVPSSGMTVVRVPIAPEMIER